MDAQTANPPTAVDTVAPRPTKPAWETYYLALAHTVSWRSGCKGAPVGAVIVRSNRILTTGYNGTPEGWPNCDDENGCPRCYERDKNKTGSVPPDIEFTENGLGDSKNLDLCVCVHAEANALITAARFGISVEGAEVYVTDMPCMQCAKELLQAGITRVTFSRYFPVAKDGSRIGQVILGTQQQLMHDLRARKYRNSNVAEDLGKWMNWLNEPHAYSLAIPRPRTSLDDDQYSARGTEVFHQWAQRVQEAQGAEKVTATEIRSWAKSVGITVNSKEPIPEKVQRLFWLDRTVR